MLLAGRVNPLLTTICWRHRLVVMDKGLELAVKKVGSQADLAKLLGISPQAVNRWRRIPVGRAIAIEKHLGIPRHELRPDIWEKV